MNRTTPMLPVLDCPQYKKWRREIMAFSRVDPVTGCWLWTRLRYPNGYGAGTSNGKPRMAHRRSYLAFRGDLDSEVVMHTCDVRHCVNPEHLTSGTQQENLKDMVRKGRDSTTKISQAQAAEICASPLSCRQAALVFGCSKAQISRIRNGKRNSRE